MALSSVRSCRGVDAAYMTCAGEARGLATVYVHYTTRGLVEPEGYGPYAKTDIPRAIRGTQFTK